MSMGLVTNENRKSRRTSYAYVEGYGWINIENFLDKIRKDVQRIEQELGDRQKSKGEFGAVSF